MTALQYETIDSTALEYRLWRRRILVSSIIGYAAYYFVRKNLSVAMPAMEANLHVTKRDLGLFLTLHGVIYGFSKFANGFLGDRLNARYFMVVGLALSAVMNIFFGLSSAVVTLGVFWMANGWFQGMGFPPCARLLTHWFSPRELATKMSIWNTSHSIGAGLISILCGYLVVVSWRLCFIVPAAIALLICVYLMFTLRDTPESLGLPEVEGTELAPEKSTARYSLAFNNRYIWFVAIANFFVYTVRYSILDWAPTFLHQDKHIELTHVGWIQGGFEGAGLVGALLAGWITDRFFGGRGGRACVFYMLLCSITVFVFWRVPVQSEMVNALLIWAAGFFIYGPQCLVGIIAANLATKRAAATAVGLTGIFGYASTVLSGVGLGWLVQHYGWSAGFGALVVVSVIGMLIFVSMWPARAHGYAEEA